MTAKWLLKYLLPGIALIGLAFFAGAQKDATLGLFGFLSFFVAGVTLIREGMRRRKNG